MRASSEVDRGTARRGPADVASVSRGVSVPFGIELRIRPSAAPDTCAPGPTARAGRRLGGGSDTWSRRSAWESYPIRPSSGPEARHRAHRGVLPLVRCVLAGRGRACGSLSAVREPYRNRRDAKQVATDRSARARPNCARYGWGGCRGVWELEGPFRAAAAHRFRTSPSARSSGRARRHAATARLSPAARRTVPSPAQTPILLWIAGTREWHRARPTQRDGWHGIDLSPTGLPARLTRARARGGDRQVGGHREHSKACCRVGQGACLYGDRYDQSRRDLDAYRAAA